MLAHSRAKGTRPAPWVVGPSRGRLDELAGAFTALSSRSAAELAREQLRRHQLDYEQGIPLYAGTNAMGPELLALHDLQLSSRPSMGWPGAKYQTGMAQVEALEVLAADLVARVMGAAHAEVRLHSASMANLAVYTAFALPGDTIAVLSDEAGGHTSHQAMGAAGVRGLAVRHLPYDVAAWDVDLDVLSPWLQSVRPKIVVLGASLMLFPHRVGAVRELCDAVGALLLYDASHVAGLLAGGAFQRPLTEGAHLVTFSTYKSLGGPAGGAIVTDDPDLAERVSSAVYPGLTANYDAGRLAPLAMRCAQLLEAGSAYAAACRLHAARLARGLSDAGLHVAGRERGFTESHHVAVDATAVGGGATLSRRLAEAGIWSSAIALPYQQAGQEPAALRLGTQEITNRGADEAFVDTLVAHLADLVLGRRDPLAVRQELQLLRRSIA